MATKRELIKAIEAAKNSTLISLKDQYKPIKEAWVSETIDTILDDIPEELYRQAVEPLRLLSVEVTKRVDKLKKTEGPQMGNFLSRSILGSAQLHSKQTLREIMEGDGCISWYFGNSKGYQLIQMELNAKIEQANEQFTAIKGNCSRMKPKEIEEYLTGLGLDWIIEEHKTPEVKYEVMAPIDVKLINQLRADKL